MINLPVAATVKTQQISGDETLRALFAALGAGRALIVGGAVRAALRGEAAGDIDIATPLHPAEVTARLEKAGFRIVPTGVEHGTVTAVADRRGFEVTTLRRDVATDGRRAVVAFTEDWVEDAQRRDFTMNTLLMDLSGQIYDPTGHGVSDLEKGIVRFVGDPATRIAEDALRILRFFRFHARYGTGLPECNGREACIHSRHLIENLSRERVTGEIEKLLPARHAAASLSSMIEGGILAGIWQESFDEKTYASLRDFVAKGDFSQKEMLLFAYCVYENKADNLLSKLDKYFIFSNRKKDFLTDIIAFVEEQHDSIEKNLYDYGASITLGGTILTHFINGKAADTAGLQAVLDRIARTPVPVFPVGAREVMAATGIGEGAALGQILKQVEAWWIGQDTKPNRQACIDQAVILAKAV